MQITSYQSEWPSLKSLQITNVGESAEKREFSYTVGGNLNWGSHCGKQYGGYWDPAVLLLDIYLDKTII